MLENLNQSQKLALEEERSSLVLACPGSGKTRILTLKIARELEKLGIRTHRIAALTFTNRASDQIDKRISYMGIDTSKLWTGTIHSFCLQWIIKPYGIYLPELKEGFCILSESEISDIKEDLKKKHDISRGKDFITRRNREGQYLNHNKKLDDMAEAYHLQILDNKNIDFDLILYFSYVLLTKYPKINKHLSTIFQYFFIDEFQDTQDLQYAIVGKIIKSSEDNCKIFLVGDPDQAIFNSLGGVVKTALEISKEIGGQHIEELKLNGNYRSTQRIINFYKNFQSVDLDIESRSSYSNEQGIISFNKEIYKEDLSEEIANIIKEKIDIKIPPNEICVLAPQWRFLTSISRQLKVIIPEIPLDAPGTSVLAYNKDNFWYKLTRLILSTRNANRYLIRVKWAKELLEEMFLFNCSTTQIDSQRCRKFLKIINSINIRNQDTIEFLEQSFKYIFDRIEINYELNELLMEQLNGFLKGIKVRYERPEFKDLSKDIIDIKKTFNSRSGVVINTCQGVKGEEFNTVIAFGLLRGYIPNWSHIINQSNATEIEESNKLLYVTSSRAKKELYLFSEKGHTTLNKSPYKVNSQLDMVDFEYDNM